MTRLFVLLLCLTCLAGCATARQRYEADLVDYRIQQSLKGVKVDEVGIPASAPSTMPNPEPATVGNVLGAILVLPLIVPLAMLESYPSYRGAHCYSYTYKDQYHVKCY
jgi:hypothetical protein